MARVDAIARRSLSVHTPDGRLRTNTNTGTGTTKEAAFVSWHS